MRKNIPRRCETAAQNYLLSCVSSCHGFKSKACAKSQPGELDGYSFGTAFGKKKPRQQLAWLITKKNGYNLKTSRSRSALQFVSTASRLKKHRRLIYLWAVHCKEKNCRYRLFACLKQRRNLTEVNCNTLVMLTLHITPFLKHRLCFKQPLRL